MMAEEPGTIEARLAEIFGNKTHPVVKFDVDS